MIKVLIGGFFGFIIGMTYGIWKVVEASDGIVVKIISFLKGVVN